MEQYNAGDRKDVRRLEKLAQQQAVHNRETICGLMLTIPGRAWLWELLTTCHIFHPSFTGEAMSTAHAEGERAVGLRILNDIMLYCPEHYVTMTREANDRRYSRERDSENSHRGDSGTGEPATAAGADDRDWEERDEARNDEAYANG